MKRTREFRSWLAPHLTRFIAVKRAGGARYLTQECLLLAFDRHLVAHSARIDARATLNRYAATLGHLSNKGRANALGASWRALSYAVRHGARLGAAPPRPPTTASFNTVRVPRILSEAEIDALLVAAMRTPRGGSCSLASFTVATLFGLLRVTGMRIGEALALDVSDIDFEDGVVTVRHGKFGKSRALPVRASTVRALRRYLSDSRRCVPGAPDAPFFVSCRTRRLTYGVANRAFHEAWARGALPAPPARPHDLRHTFAVKRVETWYQEGRDVDLLLPALSTYLGHASVENTRLYLRANGLLLEQAVRRFEHRTARLDEVAS